MRGKADPQSILFMANIDLEGRVPSDHPLRPIKRMVDADLAAMSDRFDDAYSKDGRPSVPPERLIKALLLMAIYSVRSERQLVEQIDYNLLFRWFLGLRIDEPMFDATAFTHNRERLERHGLIAAFFDGTVRRAVAAGLVSSDHFSVDGSLIEAHASIKSFKPKDRDDDDDGGGNNGFKPRNAEVNFHGQERSNATHQSTTDPQAKLYRKGDGQGAKLSHMLHALVENRHGLVLAVQVNSPLGNSEPNTAVSLLDRARGQFGLSPQTLGADKGYDQGPFLRELEARAIEPHVAMRDGPIDPKSEYYKRRNHDNIEARRRMKRRLNSVAYQVSQRVRKKLEESFGWIKTIGGLRRSRHVGETKTNQQAHVAAGAYNYIRMRNLAVA